MRLGDLAERLTEAQRAVLKVMEAESETEVPYKHSRSIAVETELSLPVARVAARSLRAAGLLEFKSGLWTADGEPYGSGWKLAESAIPLRDHLIGHPPRLAGWERCEAPGCDTLTENGICDACNAWVDEEVAKLKREGSQHEA